MSGGLSVVALRITLLDGTGAVIDLGTAKTTIRPDGPLRSRRSPHPERGGADRRTAGKLRGPAP